MTDRPGLTPPSAPDEPASPPWGAAAPPPAAPPYGVPVQYQQVTGQQNHQGALASMILGIVGLASALLALPTGGITAPGMICSPVAFGLGLWSSKVVRNRPDVYDNRGHALAGWIMGLIGILLALGALLLVLAFFGLLVWVYAGAEQ